MSEMMMHPNTIYSHSWYHCMEVCTARTTSTYLSLYITDEAEEFTTLKSTLDILIIEDKAHYTNENPVFLFLSGRHARKKKNNTRTY